MKKLLLSVLFFLPAGLCTSANNRLSAGNVANMVDRYKQAFNGHHRYTHKEAAFAEMLEYKNTEPVQFARNMHPKLEKLFSETEDAMRYVLDEVTRRARAQAAQNN